MLYELIAVRVLLILLQRLVERLIAENYRVLPIVDSHRLLSLTTIYIAVSLC